jgi:hypothetical protein
MFCTSGPSRKALVYGVTTSSYADSITTYSGPATVSPTALRVERKDDPAR